MHEISPHTEALMSALSDQTMPRINTTYVIESVPGSLTADDMGKVEGSHPAETSANFASSIDPDKFTYKIMDKVAMLPVRRCHGAGYRHARRATIDGARSSGCAKPILIDWTKNEEI
jgi:hypothetical protein